ncbi:MAG: hypothetical protein AB7E81_03755 [Hyphomicrobiaceae bacterium]
MMPEFPMLRRLARAPYAALSRVLKLHPALAFIEETKGHAVPITYDIWFRQQILGVNRGPYWPVHPSSVVVGWRNILAGVDVSPGYMPGCYIQGLGRIEIGDYTRVSANVGIMSSNHDVYDLASHDHGVVKIGRYCWLSMGVLVMPGVTLGDFTIVGAGSVVTKSFPEGGCVIAGNPARVIKQLDRSRFVERRNDREYHGYIRKEEFPTFRDAMLNV